MSEDLISRQAAIDAISTIGRTSDWKAAMAVTLASLPSAQQWIPVSSGELPKDTYWVNVSILDESGDSRSRYSSVGWYFNGTWIVDNAAMLENDSIRVVAWCELPKPWEGGEA